MSPLVDLTLTFIKLTIDILMNTNIPERLLACTVRTSLRSLLTHNF